MPVAGNSAANPDVTFEEEVRAFMEKTNAGMGRLEGKYDDFRAQIDRYDGENMELRLLMEKFNNRWQSKFSALETVEATKAAMVEFLTDQRKVLT